MLALLVVVSLLVVVTIASVVVVVAAALVLVVVAAALVLVVVADTGSNVVVVDDSGVQSKTPVPGAIQGDTPAPVFTSTQRQKLSASHCTG